MRGDGMTQQSRVPPPGGRHRNPTVGWPGGREAEAQQAPDPVLARDPDLDACRAAEHAVAERTVQVLVGAPDRAPEGLERAAAAGAGDRDPRPAWEAARHQRLVAGAVADLRPAVGERAQDRRVGLDAGVAVLVDGVADQLARAGPDRRVAVVAVLGRGDAVAVAVEVRGVGAVAVLVDAVVRDVGHARAQRPGWRRRSPRGGGRRRGPRRPRSARRRCACRRRRRSRCRCRRRS